MIPKSTFVRLATVAIGLLAALPAAHAQHPAKLNRIAFVGSGAIVPLDAFRQTLKELGYVEGRNVIVEAQFAENRPDRLPDLIAAAVAKKPDVLVVTSTPAALAAKKSTTTIPVVFASVFDPVGAGVVASLARPGSNITGASIGVGGSGLAGKWIELLNEAVPRMSHVAVLANVANPAGTASVREVETAARTLKIKLDVHDARNVADLDRALASITASGAQALIVTNDPFFTANRDKLVQFAASKRVPAVYFFRLFAEAGGLMSYGASLDDSYRSAAKYVDKILKGARPADLPIEQPTRFELVINLKAAQKLGLTIPPAMRARAEVIE